MIIQLSKKSSHEIISNHQSLLLDNQNGNIIDTYIKTYYRPDDLEDSRYNPSFSLIVYPGQEVEFLFENANNYQVDVEIYFIDLFTNDKIVISREVNVNPGICSIRGVIDNNPKALVSRVGIRISGSTSEENSLIYINHLKIMGQPTYEMDFKSYQIEDYGFSYGRLHTEVLGCSYSKGLCELEYNTMVGSCADSGELLFGLYSSKNYIYEVSLKPHLGFNHLINFRMQGLARSYLFGFNGKNKVSLLKKHIRNKEILSKDFSYSLEKWYNLKVIILDNNIECYIDDNLIFSYEDNQNSYDFGQQGFTVLDSSRCSYKDVRITAI